MHSVASAAESGGDGSSVEEKLEELENVGDVGSYSKCSEPTYNGGYTWKVKFLFDEDGPCQQKDDMLGLCNSPGNVPNGE